MDNLTYDTATRHIATLHAAARHAMLVRQTRPNRPRIGVFVFGRTRTPLGHRQPAL